MVVLIVLTVTRWLRQLWWRYDSGCNSKVLVVDIVVLMKGIVVAEAAEVMAVGTLVGKRS